MSVNTLARRRAYARVNPSPLCFDPSGAVRSCPSIFAGPVITTSKENTMTKLIANIRRVLKAFAYRAKVKFSVALSLPGFLKVEVEYERDLSDEPPAA